MDWPCRENHTAFLCENFVIRPTRSRSVSAKAAQTPRSDRQQQDYLETMTATLWFRDGQNMTRKRNWNRTATMAKILIWYHQPVNYSADQ